MARSARGVSPGLPHHITQWGNRRQATFFGADDYRASIEQHPIRAGLAEQPWEYPWSSAAAHVAGEEDFVVKVEGQLGRSLRPGTPGRKAAAQRQ